MAKNSFVAEVNFKVCFIWLEAFVRWLNFFFICINWSWYYFETNLKIF